MYVARSRFGLDLLAQFFSFFRTSSTSSRSSGLNSRRHLCKKEIPEYKILKRTARENSLNGHPIPVGPQAPSQTRKQEKSDAFRGL